MPVPDAATLDVNSTSTAGGESAQLPELLPLLSLLSEVRELPSLARTIAHVVLRSVDAAWVRVWIEAEPQGAIEVAILRGQEGGPDQPHTMWHPRSPLRLAPPPPREARGADMDLALRRALGSLGPALGEAWQTLPLIDDGSLRGLVAVGPSQRQQPELLAWVVRQGSLALERLGLEEALQDARGRADEEVRERRRAEARLGFLAEAGEILASPMSLDAICEELARIAVPRLADRCLVHVPERNELRCAAWARTPPEAAESEAPPTPPISMQALHSRRIVAREEGAQGPDEPRSLLAVPLIGRDFLHGVMTLAMDDGTRRFDPEDISLARALAHRAVLALDKARLFSEAQRARAAAEQESLVRRAAEERQRFLAEASRVLSSSLDAQEILRNLARLVVPRLSDGCVVDFMEAGQVAERVASVHQAPELAELAWELAEQYPPSPDWPVGIPRVLRTGISERLAVVRDSDLDALSESPGHRRKLGELRLESILTVPLWVRARVVGAVTLVHSESGRHFSRADQAVAEDLAGRAGLAVENARLYADLQEEDRRKDEFLAMLAHELRNPLAPVQVAVQLLQQGKGSAASDHHAHEVIARQTRHMARLVDDLLDLSRITRGKIELRRERVDLHALIRRATDLAQPQVLAKRHQLVVELSDGPMWIDADPVRIEQVLANLINNAAKYTDPGGVVTVQASRLGGGLELVVRDTGIGIAPEMLAGIFELFVQEKRASDRSQGGLGIGLTLVKQLVELHGGVVSAHSEGFGKGSEFRVRLPVPTDMREEAAPPAPQQSAGSLRVLVVDDNVDAADTLAELLESWGHVVRSAHDGLQGLEEAQRFEPDVVLLDIGLPRMDGLEVARRLRSRPGEPRTVLVALTGYGQAEDRARSLEAGFDHHLTKPVDLDTLVRVLEQVRAVGGA